jgi:SAM-dependent methyltransferase
MIGSQKFYYFLSSLVGCFDNSRSKCPSCNSEYDKVVDRKYFVTKLVRCSQCKLLFRAPTDSAKFLDGFYDDEYSEELATTLPSKEELEKLKANGFRGHGRDFSEIIVLLKSLFTKQTVSILDFGCSWGYGAFQFKSAGFDAYGYEVGRTRFEFAKENFNLPFVSNLEELDVQFDIVFSSHVFEHIPSLDGVLTSVMDLIKVGGFLVAITPNGSCLRKEQNYPAYHSQWGLVHPLNIDFDFYERRFQDLPYLAGSTNLQLQVVRDWDRKSQIVDETVNDDNLLIIVHKTGGV